MSCRPTMDYSIPKEATSCSMFIFLISEQISAHKPPLFCLSTNFMYYPLG